MPGRHPTSYVQGSADDGHRHPSSDADSHANNHADSHGVQDLAGQYQHVRCNFSVEWMHCSSVRTGQMGCARSLERKAGCQAPQYEQQCSEEITCNAWKQDLPVRQAICWARVGSNQPCWQGQKLTGHVRQMYVFHSGCDCHCHRDVHVYVVHHGASSLCLLQQSRFAVQFSCKRALSGTGLSRSRAPTAPSLHRSVSISKAASASALTR